LVNFGHGVGLLGFDIFVSFSIVQSQFEVAKVLEILFKPAYQLSVP